MDEQEKIEIDANVVRQTSGIIADMTKTTLQQLRALAAKNDFMIELMLEYLINTKAFKKTKQKDAIDNIHAVLKIYNKQITELGDELIDLDSKLEEITNDIRNSKKGL